ncbi:hypothetical protein JCM9533A_13250 [Catenuloplanes niger JCM 9533]
MEMASRKRRAVEMASRKRRAVEMASRKRRAVEMASRKRRAAGQRAGRGVCRGGAQAARSRTASRSGRVLGVARKRRSWKWRPLVACRK